MEEPQKPPRKQKSGISVPAGLVGLILVLPWIGFRGVVPFVFFVVGTVACFIGLFQKGEAGKWLGGIGLAIAALLWLQFFAAMSPR